MMTVSAKWQASVQASHKITSRVEVWRGGVQVLPDVPITSGKVIWDWGADIVCEARVNVAEPSYVPVAADAPMLPTGNELRVYSGIRYPDGSDELVRLFSGPIVTCPTWPIGNQGKFEVVATGWTQYLIDDRFTSTYTPSGSTIEAIRNLCTGAGLSFAVGPGVVDATVPAGLSWTEDRLDAVQTLARSLNAVVRDTVDGTVMLSVDAGPNTQATPVKVLTHGNDGLILDQSETTSSREQRFNGVLAMNPDNPDCRHLATITSGPLQWGGAFGRKPYMFSSPLLTPATVQQAAETRLLNLDGRLRVITLSIVPDASIMPGDHVMVQWPPIRGQERSAPTEELLFVRKVTHPLTPGYSELELQGVGTGVL